MANGYRTIIHPTDFSDLSVEAFMHALRIALANRGKLNLVHVAETDDPDEWIWFPHVRHALVQWGLLGDSDPPTAVADKLGIKVAKVGLEPQDPLRGLLRFLEKNPSDLIVVATHGRAGLAHWLGGSIAEDFSRQAKLPTLFVAPSARGFVDQGSGKLSLRRVLVPVDHAPPPAEPLRRIGQFVAPLSEHGVALDLFHVGATAPAIRRASDGAIVPVETHGGEVVGTILKLAVEREADLIAMPTAGHRGFLDAVRGSTTERVLRHAPCPVLAVPA